MSELKIDPNDCLAAELMRREDIKEIYSFDREFDDVGGLRRVTWHS